MTTTTTIITITAGLFCFIPNTATGATINMPADDVFDRASVALVDLGALPTFRDKELGVIKTEPVQVKLTPDQADCGKMFNIPYLKDNRTKTAATYQVRVKRLSAVTSDMEVKVTLDGYMDANEGAPFFIEKTRDKNKALTCKSTGFLEQQLVEKITGT